MLYVRNLGASCEPPLLDSEVLEFPASPERGGPPTQGATETAKKKMKKGKRLEPQKPKTIQKAPID